MKTPGWILLFGSTILMLAAITLSLAASPSPPAAGFGDYWYQGKAEITSYSLEQARYGEIHPGHAVLVYVTEDFSRSKQVKLDQPAAAGADAVKILKLNQIKKFTTGIYPYSMMTSVFGSVGWEGPPETLKITTSAQEWCGHTFVQLNRSENGFRVQQNSYFESEGDLTRTLDHAIPEDGLWITIRLNPERLPTGAVKLIPGTMFTRLRHQEWKVQSAQAELKPVSGQEDLMAYTLSYPDLGRTLTVQFHRDFPHEIEGWEETHPSGWGTEAKPLTTRAHRLKRIRSAYWTQNGTADASLRKELGLN